MTRGKVICSVLKAIRKQVADANEIKYEPRECHHQGECRGTCPACEAEVKYIERELDLRRQLGKAVAIMGISAGLSALTACGEKAKNVDSISEKESMLTVGKTVADKRTAPFRNPAPKADKKNYNPLEDEEVLGRTGGVNDVEPVPIPNPILNPDSTEEVYGIVEQMPSFPGGSAALMEYISKNIRYPKGREESSIQGRVIVTFVVEKDGKISNIKVAKSLHPLFDAEAVRVVSSMPNWIPGRQNGVAYRVKYTIPVTFRQEKN